jgi:hypothetical protein
MQRGIGRHDFGHGSDIELDSAADRHHPNYDTGIIALIQRSICGGVTGLPAAFVAGNVA